MAPSSWEKCFSAAPHVPDYSHHRLIHQIQMDNGLLVMLSDVWLPMGEWGEQSVPHVWSVPCDSSLKRKGWKQKRGWRWREETVEEREREREKERERKRKGRLPNGPMRSFGTLIEYWQMVSTEPLCKIACMHTHTHTHTHTHNMPPYFTSRYDLEFEWAPHQVCFHPANQRNDAA